jgi:4-amino-4-deoxy-L-arabinose transferase-like glycosyltransferase
MIDAHPPRPGLSPLAALLLASAALHGALASLTGLSVDESYAVVMGRNLRLSYYDHPPLLFWIPGLAARLAGSEHPLAVRLPFILMFVATTWLVSRLGARLFNERAGFWAALVLNLTLFFTLSAACWILPDGPLLLWSAAGALCLAHVATLDPEPARRAETTWWWLGFGLFAGLALLSKYHGAFLLAGGGLFLLTSAPHRRWLGRPQPYLAVMLAAIVFLPVLAWNWSHGWASFRFQGSRAVPIEGQSGAPLLDCVLGQAAWMLPWVWLALLWVLVKALRRGPRDASGWLLACLAIGPIAFFTLVAALGRRGLPHWEAPGYFMLLPLLGTAVAARLERGDRWIRRWLWGSAAGLAAVLLVVLAQVHWGWATSMVPALLRLGDPTDDLVHWQPVVTRLHDWGYPRTGVDVAGATWADAAKIAYALGPGVAVTSVGPDPRGFEYVQPQQSLVGHDVLIVARRRRGPEPMVAYAPYFARITALGTVPLERAGHPQIAVSVYLGQRLLRPVPPDVSR